MSVFRGKGFECWDCVFAKNRDAEAKDIICGVNNGLPYRSYVNGKQVLHPAHDCSYFIERHIGNSCLEFTVKLRNSTITCENCHNAFVHPAVPLGAIYCVRLQTNKPRDSWCEDWEQYRPEEDFSNA
jgi:hypothetical protein